MDRKAYSPNEVAQLVGVGRTFVYQQIKDKRLKIRKAGSRTLITDEAVDDWLKNLPTRSETAAAST